MLLISLVIVLSIPVLWSPARADKVFVCDYNTEVSRHKSVLYPGRCADILMKQTDLPSPYKELASNIRRFTAVATSVCTAVKYITRCSTNYAWAKELSYRSETVTPDSARCEEIPHNSGSESYPDPDCSWGATNDRDKTVYFRTSALASCSALTGCDYNGVAVTSDWTGSTKKYKVIGTYNSPDYETDPAAFCLDPDCMQLVFPKLSKVVDTKVLTPTTYQGKQCFLTIEGDCLVKAAGRLLQQTTYNDVYFKRLINALDLRQRYNECLLSRLGSGLTLSLNSTSSGFLAMDLPAGALVNNGDIVQYNCSVADLAFQPNQGYWSTIVGNRTAYYCFRSELCYNKELASEVVAVNATHVRTTSGDIMTLASQKLLDFDSVLSYAPKPAQAVDVVSLSNLLLFGEARVMQNSSFDNSNKVVLVDKPSNSATYTLWFVCILFLVLVGIAFRTLRRATARRMTLDEI